MSRYLLSATLGMIATAVVLAFSTATPTAFAQKGKAPPPPTPVPKPKAPTPFPRPGAPFPGTHFPAYRSHAPHGMSGLHGVSALLRMPHALAPTLLASRCPTRLGVAPLGVAPLGGNQCLACHPTGFGGLGLGRRGHGAVAEALWLPAIAGGDPLQSFLADLMHSGPPVRGGFRHQLLLDQGLDPDVMGLLSGRHQARPFGGAGLSPFLMLEDHLGPLGSNPFGRLTPFGRSDPLGLRHAHFPDLFGGFGALDMTLRPGGYRSLPMHPLLMDHMWGSGFYGGIGAFDFDGFGGFGYGGGFGFGGTFGRPRGLGIGLPGMGLPGGRLDPFGRYGLLPPPRPRPVPRAPSKDEQRTALEKFEKSLGGVETLVRAGAWSALGSGLEKTGAVRGVPEAVSVPLKGIQTEAARLDELLRLRDALTTTWGAAPDPAALARHIDALRAATGDTELADRLTRLLAVKALWEGHAAAAARLCGGESLNLDAELESLRRPQLANAAQTDPITTDEDRVTACQRVVRELLGAIDHHLDCGRYSVSVHLADVRTVRGGVTKAAKALAGEPKPGAETFETVAAEVSKALGRKLTEADRVILRQMHAAKKSVAEMTAAVR